MKKKKFSLTNLFLIFAVIVFPYTLFLALYCLYSGFLMDTVFHNNGYLLLAALAIIAILCSFLTVLLCLKLFFSNRSGKSLLTLNLIIKLCHIPAYLIIFILSLIFLISVWGTMVVFVFILYDLWCIGMSGSIAAASLYKTMCSHQLTIRQTIRFGILEFLFVIDVFCALYLFFYVRKKTVQPELSMPQ